MDRICERKEVLLEIADVSRALGGQPILSHVSATIRDVVRPGLSQGQVVAVLGPSGIGKTQLLRLLAGLESPDSGEVRVGRAQEPVQRGQVGVVAQNYPLFEHYTVLANLRVAARSPDADHKVTELLRRFGLYEQRNCYPATLSGGQRQRAAIAQQLLRSNEILLMDEPFSGLDPVMVEEVCKLIQEVASLDELFTIVVVTHDIDAALTVADTIWLLGRGRSDGGATIVDVVDLVERGLAWEGDIRALRALPAYAITRNELETRFLSL